MNNFDTPQIPHVEYIALTDKQTDRQTHNSTNITENNITLAARIVNTITEYFICA